MANGLKLWKKGGLLIHGLAGGKVAALGLTKQAKWSKWAQKCGNLMLKWACFFNFSKMAVLGVILGVLARWG